MSEHGSFEAETSRALLDQLLEDSRLYTKSKDYKDLLDFVVRLRNFSPFNAMLLQVQKPGLGYAASSRDWRERFGRTTKEGVRPLLILRPFGPVGLVYDVLDTEGSPVPESVFSFPAVGAVESQEIQHFAQLIEQRHIECCWVDNGDKNAGSIRVLHSPTNDKDPARYKICLNRNHQPVIQFCTLVHELGHLFLGHLGADKTLKVSERGPIDYPQKEFEAESVSYIVCKRRGIESKSEIYLAGYVSSKTTVEHVDVYRVMKAAGQVEALLSGNIKG